MGGVLGSALGKGEGFVQVFFGLGGGLSKHRI